MPYTIEEVNKFRMFSKSFRSYQALLRYVNKGRSPTVYGVPRSSYRLFRVDSPSPRIDIYYKKYKLAELTPNNIVTFTATRQVIANIGSGLSATLQRVLPAICDRVRSGEYRLLAPQDYVGLERIWHTPAGVGQEYFEHLKLDLSSGKIINSKDMTPIVNNDKRKQWLAGIKSARLLLRAQARIGALEGRRDTGGYLYLGRDRLTKIAECVMQGKLDDDCITAMANSIPRYKLKDYSNEGMAIVDRFESLIKSHSRDMRLHVGVIDIAE